MPGEEETEAEGWQHEWQEQKQRSWSGSYRNDPRGKRAAAEISRGGGSRHKPPDPGCLFPDRADEVC